MIVSYVLFLIALGVLVVLLRSMTSRQWVLSRGGIAYQVCKDTAENMLEVADALAEIDRRVDILAAHVQHFKTDATAELAQRLATKFNDTTLCEAARDNKLTTYTVDKRKIYVCVRQKVTPHSVVSINTLVYVVLHELAHFCNFDRTGKPIDGHGEEFLRIFRYLVQNATTCGVYEYVDYKTKPELYCGMVLASQILTES